MPQNVVSLRLPDEMKERLDRLSKSTKRSRSYLASEALGEYGEYIERHEWQIAVIDEADKGEMVSHEAVPNG